MGITLREFTTKWGFEVNDSELKKLDKSFAETRKNMETLSKNITSFGTKLSIGITAPFLALSGFSIKAAAEASDFEARFRAVFAGIGEDGVKAVNDLGISLGMSSSEVQKLISGTGQFLQNLGFTNQQSLEFSKTVATLSADVAEFNNIEGGSEAVQRKIQDALAGRTVGLKDLGVAIDQDLIKQTVAQNKAQGVTFATERQAEAYAILTQVQKQTANAAGAFTGATEDVDVAMARLRARTTNVVISFGKLLIPTFLKIVSIGESVVAFFDSMSERTRTVILIAAGLAAALGPLLIIFGSILNAVMAIRTAMVLFGNASLLAALKFIALPLLVGAAVVALGLIIEDIYGFFTGKDSLTGVIVASVDEMVAAFQTKFPIIGTVVRSVVEGLLTPIRAVIGAVRGVSALIGTIAGGGGVLGGLKAGISEFGASTFGAITDQDQPFSLERTLGVQGIRPSGAGATGNQSVTQNVNSPITVTVPPGTPPQAVGPAVRQGITDGLSNLLRETGRQVKGPVTN